MDVTALDRVFIDTNVFVYAYDAGEPAKQQRAQTVLDSLRADAVVISPQVLGEFYSTVTRRMSLPLTREEARSAIDFLFDFNVVVLDKGVVRDAIGLVESASIGYWDALIVKAASSAGCRVLLTEDLSNGQVIDGVRIENPFADL